MGITDTPVALVTGASRGAGAGIARTLGRHGMRVYVTGRAETVGKAKGWDGAPLPGTIHSTAAEVTAAGGEVSPFVVTTQTTGRSLQCSRRFNVILGVWISW